MYRYYAAPARREGAAFFVDSLNGACVLADTPHDASIRLGLPETGETFAVWLFGRAVDPDRFNISLEEAGQICSKTPPHRIFVCLGDTVLPLDVDPALVSVEVGRAGGD